MKVSVVGLGHVGAVAAVSLAAGGHEVLGIDIDLAKVKTYRHGKLAIYEPGLQHLLTKGLANSQVRFLHTSEVSEPLGDVVMIAAGTPTTSVGSADLTEVRSAIGWIREKQPRGGVIAMKSTVPPGTGVQISDGFLCNSGFRYVSNPEFLREGKAVSDWFHPDRIVVGGDGDSVRVIREMYADIEAPYVVTDITSAEMIKYAANAFLATKISFINEIATLCDRLGVDVDDVSQGIALDPRIGGSFLQAGVGYGGSCFPKDVRALDQLALNNGHNFELLRSVITVNNRQRLLPLFCLREAFGRLKDVPVAVLGIAFKPDTDDVREAPAVDLIRALVKEGARVSAYDPQAVDAAARALPDSVTLTSDLMECVNGARALVLMTEWPEIVEADWEAIAQRVLAPHFLFDGRNSLDPDLITGLGFQYKGVGRSGARDAQC